MKHYFNKGAVKSKKEVQEQFDKMNSLYNDIVRHIQNMESTNDYLVLRQLIKEYESLEGVSHVQVVELYNWLYDGLKILLEESEERRDNMSVEVEKIQQRSYVEDVSTLKNLNVQSSEIMFQFQMKLNQNTTKESGEINRRLVGNWVKNADRVHSIALSKLSLMPEYCNLFTDKQKRVLPERAKSSEQRLFENKKNADLETAQQKLSTEYMNGFKLRTAVKQMEEIVNGSQYFGGGASE